MKQRSEEWYAARLGRLTASRIADATARTRSGWGASRANYMAELLVERLTGQRAPQYTNAAMEWGTQYEAEARTAYEFLRNIDVEEVGFIPHPRIPQSGASPDGLVGSEGMVEFKCPSTANHIETFLGEPIGERYEKQMYWQMACCPGRRWCDFVSYDPRLPPEYRMVIRRLDLNYAEIAKLEKEAETFLNQLDAKHQALVEMAQGRSGDSLRKALEASVAKETAA